MIHRADLRLLLPMLAAFVSMPWVTPATLAAEAPAPAKVLRYSFRIAETGFDPAQVSDLYSRNITGNIFDSPYRYAFLARPVKMVPNTADGLPEVSADFKTFTVRIRPGIYFSD